MDTGEGRFVRFEAENEKMLKDKLAELNEKYKKAKGVFQVGEELEIRGSRFIIKDISPFGMKLKLLPSME